jgi:heme/copper-type cytochrome/quinol oxidase subunit 2
VTPDKPGHYIWQCFDPCGSGFNGFGGPMSTKGYMSGTINVVA